MFTGHGRSSTVTNVSRFSQQIKAALPATVFAAIAIVTGVGDASAQAPPMDMSWALRSQAYNWNMGNYMAARIGQQCYQYLLALRARGYYGPADCGANAATLQNSINRLQNSYYNYNAAQMYNSWVRQQAVTRAGQAITGQYVQPYNCWYYGRYVCR
jgi:hypothetical protein